MMDGADDWDERIFFGWEGADGSDLGFGWLAFCLSSDRPLPVCMHRSVCEERRLTELEAYGNMMAGKRSKKKHCILCTYLN